MSIIASPVNVVGVTTDVAGVAMRPRPKLFAWVAVNVFPETNVVLAVTIKPYQPNLLESRTPKTLLLRMK